MQQKFNKTGNNFTSQYVSIKSTREAIQGVNYNTLHPNMFLLNPYVVPNPNAYAYFTSQYVSIKSMLLYVLLIFLPALHPNMFLLNLISGKSYCIAG